MSLPSRRWSVLLLALMIQAGILIALSAWAQDVDKRVLELEAKRIAVIDKVKPAVVAIFARGGQGGGSGVIVSKDGYALTNFHVVEGSGPVMKCGLADGVLYDAVLVGLDKVGDVALIKLLPKEKGKDFPLSPLGDSDKVKAGDWSLAMGNPFLLATDFNPTVTFGLVSGVHRYQYPAGTLLEYTDCIQIDTSINPGNSGGPLFNMEGELIGINGRGSFEKRGRVNSGVGYAISINQIKNFMGHLRSGIDTDHATLGAVVKSEEESGDRMVVQALVDESDVARRGLQTGDELVFFAGRPMTSVNQYKNVLGLFPKGWRMPLVYRRDNSKHEVLARLMKLQQDQSAAGPRKPQPGPKQPAPAPSEASKFYEPKPGFANYYFNKLERDRLLAEFRKHGDFSTATGPWTIEADASVRQKPSTIKVAISEEDDKTDNTGKPIVRKWTYHLDPQSLPALPDGEAKDEPALRQAVRKAAGLLRKHAAAFPQEIFARDSDAQWKEYLAAFGKEIDAGQKALFESLEELKKAGKARDKEESRLWQAHYDFTLARLSAFAAYVQEYQFLFGQLSSATPPPRDPKKHRGWRMAPDEKLQSGAATQKLKDEAEAVWQKMIKDYDGTVWEDRAKDGRKTLLGLKWQPTGGTRTIVAYKTEVFDDRIDPLKLDQNLRNLKDPPGSGGLMIALYQYRHFLTQGLSGFEGHFSHGGHEPIYPSPADDKKPSSFKDLRVDTEVILTEHAAVSAKWFFSLKDQTLLAFEVWVDKEDDPCEVYLSDYRMVEGRQMPHRFEVRHGNDRYGILTIKKYDLK